MKKIFVILFVLFVGLLNVFAKGNSFNIDMRKIKFAGGDKITDIKSNFNPKYAINFDSNSLKANSAFEKRMTDLANKVTYLLLGKVNYKNGDYADYVTRKNALLELRYAPIIPKDSEGNFITTSQEYKDDVATGINIPSMFKLLAEKNITYQNLGTTKIFTTDDYIITRIALSGVKIEMPNVTEPMKIDTLETNLVLTYFFKEADKDYQLYWIMAETSDDVEPYFLEKEQSENDNNTLSKNSKYIAAVSNLYDYTKLNNLPENTIKKIYNDNLDSIVILNTYYDKSIIQTGTGFFINKGIVVTTWSYIEKALMDGQFIIIRDKAGNVYNFEGFISAAPELDIAIIKLHEQNNNVVVLGDSSTIKREDPVIAISSKSGYGLSINAGIVVSSDTTIKSLIPLSQTDEGSPLFSSDGKVIGINTARSINSSLSIAVPTNYLKTLQTTFETTSFADIKTISFTELKDKYYYNNYNNENVINNIDKSTWNVYKKVGNIENTIKLSLVKANYYGGILSLRYTNKISRFIGNMNMASSFKGELLDDGYKATLVGEKKCVYENNQYKIVILDEFNYLIVVIIRK